MIIQNVRIARPANNGLSIGHIDGKVAFVNQALPGELVNIRIRQEKKDYVSAEVVAVIEASPDRINPQCLNYAECGGCCYLHCNYLAEIAMKKQIVLDILARTAKIPNEQVPDVDLIYGERFGYRSHATVKFVAGRAGFYQKDSHLLVPFGSEGCLLLHENINKGISNAHILSGEKKVAVDSNLEFIIDEEKVVSELEKNMIYHRWLSSFFQVNRFLRSLMLETVQKYAALSPGDTFVDMGCGVGFFSLYLAQFAKQGCGCDTNRQSVAWAKKNARLNKIENIVFKNLPDHALHPVHDRADIVIADPPRAGISKRTRKTIIAMQPRKIIYISCNPATYARDLATFMTAGYALRKMSMIDMFPGTSHIELISEIVRK